MKAEFLLYFDNFILISVIAGKIIGLKLKECAHIGTIKMQVTHGWIIGPPALNAYALLPFGVLIIIPSPWVVVSKVSYKYISRLVVVGFPPLSIIISLRD